MAVSKKMKIILALATAFVLIVLPTGLDDAITTIPIIWFFGIKIYLALALIALVMVLLIWNYKRN